MQYKRIELTSTDGAVIPLDAYCPHVSEQIDADVKRPAVVICPGGGYRFLSEREAEPVALVFAAAGFNAFVVWNRVAPHRFPAPQQDAACAMAYVRTHAEADHTDPHKVAILGFSAGGHLAGSMGVMWQREDLWQPLSLTPAQVRPDAMVLCYPVITGGVHAHRDSFVALTGSEDVHDHEAFSLDTMVNAQTPPTFLWTTWDDGSVPAENTLFMATALKRAGVQSEVHIFPHGGHGASLCSEVTSGIDHAALTLPDCAVWVNMAQRFLRNILG